MFTTPLLALLCAVPVLGEAGESCRSDSDCEASLSCVASTCSARRLPPVPERAPVAAPVEEPSPVEEGPQPHFSGVHFFLGVMGGAGPMWASATTTLYDALLSFSASGLMLHSEARIGVLFGRFELAAEVAPLSDIGFANGASSHHGIGAISAGWMLGLYEREGFGISLPIRARGGLFLTPRGGGSIVGASIGVAFRFGHALLEARLLGVEQRSWWAANITSVPFSLGFSWIF